MHRIPLTIFDLVEPKSLHKLYGMLALALDEDTFFGKDATAEEANESFADTSASSHLSIILPAKKFRHASTRYEVTVSHILCHHACNFIAGRLQLCAYSMFYVGHV